MISDPVFYPLLLAALVLVCMIVHAWRPDPSRATPPPVKPIKPRHQRSKEPKPFAGYLQQPLCEACEHGLDLHPQAPGSPPPAIIFTRGRKRAVDTTGHLSIALEISSKSPDQNSPVSYADLDLNGPL